MIKRKEQMKTRVGERVFGGEGTLHFLDLFEREETQKMTRIFSIITLEPGCSIGPHIHRGEVEIYYLLQGRAQVLDQGQWIDLAEGDGVFTPKDVEHGIRNPFHETARLLAVVLEEAPCSIS